MLRNVPSRNFSWMLLSGKAQSRYPLHCSLWGSHAVDCHPWNITEAS
jgi:hypothetical protein